MLSELSDASASGLAADSVAPKFTQLLKDMEAPEGNRVRFDCRVIGHPAPEVKWYRGSNEITNSTDFQVNNYLMINFVFVVIIIIARIYLGL